VPRSIRPSKLTDPARRLALWALAALLGGCRCSNVEGGPPGVAGGADPEGRLAAASVAAGSRMDPPHAAASARPLVPGMVRWVGRVDASDPTAVKLAWSGAGFVATVNGTKISVKLRTEDAQSAFFQTVIDGQIGPRVEVPGGDAQTVVLADGISPGDHTLEVYRETEGMYGHSVFGGFVDGMLKGAPTASGRLIEVIGDSISAGYGNLGKEVHPPWDNACSFSLDTESSYQSYGAMVGRALDAEVSIVARSGWGMYRDANGDPAAVMRSVYANAIGTEGAPAWSFQRKADAVIINLGTNDSKKGDPGRPYEDAYVAFLRTVRGHYPGAWIFLTLGPMTSEPQLTPMRAHLKSVAAALADDKIVVVDLPVQDATSTGCDYHPNVAEDATMAGVLTRAIREKLHW
jgi:lysophospholipase L1-like esterase